MSEFVITSGNTVSFKILVKDVNGVVVQTLDTATEIKFEAKNPLTKETVFSKSIGNGVQPDQPSKGYILVNLAPEDTDALPEGHYKMAAQIKWGAENVYELELMVDNRRTKDLHIEEDIIV